MKPHKKTRDDILSDQQYQGKWVVIIETPGKDAQVVSRHKNKDTACKAVGVLRKRGLNASAYFVGSILEPGTAGFFSKKEGRNKPRRSGSAVCAGTSPSKKDTALRI
ncbi:hypothetical protein HY625_00020 [Candidatus Uhrbacteria bacterium]|nr:hypothetical protein [Candidatus Uhrbacteria bacterium]